MWVTSHEQNGSVLARGWEDTCSTSVFESSSREVLSGLDKHWIGFGISSQEMRLPILMDELAFCVTAQHRLITTPMKLTHAIDQEHLL